jgi:hypothetical protein
LKHAADQEVRWGDCDKLERKVKHVTDIFSTTKIIAILSANFLTELAKTFTRTNED